MDRPARLQVDPDTILDDDKPPQTGDTFNIWYLKWSGGDSSNVYTKLKYRVNIKKDSGRTKAEGNNPLCLFFARGCCYLGKDCKYYHRLPMDDDFRTPTQDCFGRDKTADYRDDMDGVGSFNKHNRTLYVGGLHSKCTEAVLTKHFEEFGPIEYVKVLRGKNCAFITFKLESQAQFVKEAMQNQLLDDKEILNIRWANEDPDPNAQMKEKRRLEEIAYETIQNILKDTDDGDTHMNKKARTEPVVVEPVSDDDKAEKSTVQKTIEPKSSSNEPRSSSTLVFDKDTLRKIAVSKVAKPKPKQTLASLVASYSSDEEDD